MDNCQPICFHKDRISICYKKRVLVDSLLFILLWNTVPLLCSSDCSETHYIYQNGLEVKRSVSFASWVRGLKAFTMPGKDSHSFIHSLTHSLTLLCLLEEQCVLLNIKPPSLASVNSFILLWKRYFFYFHHFKVYS